MKNKLRPIGIEFEIEHPPMESSTNTEITMAEMIEAIDIRVKKK